MPSQFRKDHIRELDGIRGIAVLMVLWVHLPKGALGSAVRHAQSIVIPGNLGVDLFFVLSGFLITRILLVDRERGVPLRYFLFRRFLRIFPIYYLTIAILLDRHRVSESIAAATYASNYFSIFHKPSWPLEHSWSLAVEEHFYLFWPPIVAFFTPKVSHRALLFGVIPLALATLAWAFFFGPWAEHDAAMHKFVLRSSTVRFLSLGLGALVAYHELRLRSSKWLSGAIVAAAVLRSATLTLRGLHFTGLEPFFQQNEANHNFANWYMSVVGLMSFPLISVATVVLAVAWSGSRLPIAWIFRIGVLGWVGRISYGLYLYHFPIFKARGIWGANSVEPEPLRTFVVLLLCFGVATASYWIIERPLLRFGGRFRGVPNSKPTDPHGSDSEGADTNVPTPAAS